MVKVNRSLNDSQTVLNMVKVQQSEWPQSVLSVVLQAVWMTIIS